MSRSNFAKFPRTPHLTWLGDDSARDDKMLSPAEAEAFLSGEIVVEEKVDGTNIGISLGDDLQFRVQSRGSWISRDTCGQYSLLWSWLTSHGETLEKTERQNLILFGEWCFARHSVQYDCLPDWFLLFDIYDKDANRFWSTSRRHDFATRFGLSQVPLVNRGKFSIEQLVILLETKSILGPGKMEGIYLRRENSSRLLSRAKLVSADFVQAISEHWSRKPLEPNQLKAMVGAP